MKPNNANTFYQDIVGFFFNHFSNFEFFAGNPVHNECAYYHNYRKYGLSIVVVLPLTNIDDNNWAMTGKKIQISLKKTREKTTPHIIELTDTLITSNYHDRLRERIGILKELVDEIHQCQKCDSKAFLVPKTMRRNDTKRTWYVALWCPACHHYTWTTFGVGLKTRLHKNLQRIRTH